MAGYSLFRTVYWLAHGLPRPGRTVIAWLMANYYWLRNKRERDVTVRTLRAIKGKSYSNYSIKWLAWKTFQNYGQYLADFSYAGRMSPREMDRRIQIKGEENIARALAGGHGAIILTGHIGNWELGASVVAHSGFPIDAIYLQFPDERISNLYVNQRKRCGVGSVPLGKTWTALKVLSQGRILAMLGDILFGNDESAADVVLFGQHAKFPRGPVLISVVTGAPIIPCALVMKNRGKYFIFFEQPLYPDVNQPRDAEVARLTNIFAGRLESWIRRWPDQWFPLREIWNMPAESRDSN